MLVVGLDPGGAAAFGWAILSGSFDAPQFVVGGVCTGARAAVEAAAKHLHVDPLAVGIDAPLFWSASGDRRADSIVRKLVCKAGGRGGTVSHVNSLQGACLVEGAIAARLVRDRWPVAQITEAHPRHSWRSAPRSRRSRTCRTFKGRGITFETRHWVHFLLWPCLKSESPGTTWQRPNPLLSIHSGSRSPTGSRKPNPSFKRIAYGPPLKSNVRPQGECTRPHFVEFTTA